MTVRVRHQIHEDAIARLFLSDRIASNMFLRGLRVESQAKRELSSTEPRRVDTGLLRSSIHTSRIISNGRRGARVGTPVKYGWWVHRGTGIYGPYHTRIVPRTKQALRFKPKGSRNYVFAKSVAGMKRNQYLLNALPAARLP